MKRVAAFVFAAGALAGVGPARAVEEANGTLPQRLDEGRIAFANAAAQRGGGDVERAASMFADGAKRFSDMRGLFCYGLAACYAQLGRPGLGCEWLEKAVEAGYWNLTAIEKDPDLAKIRKLKKFQDAIGRMRVQINKARSENPPVTRFGVKINSPKAVLVLVHADGGSAEEILERISADAASFGIACAAIEGPVLVGKHLRMWSDRADTMRRIRSGAEIAKREFKGKELPLFVGGHLEGGYYVLQYLLAHPRELAAAFAVDPVIDEGLLAMAEGGIAAPPAAIIELGSVDKDTHNLRRRYFETLRKNNRMARLLGAGTISMALPGTFRWMFTPNAGG